MLFHSILFLPFLGAVLIGVWLFRKFRPQGIPFFLLLCSYFFYGSWSWKYLALILLSTLIDYTVALRLERTKENNKRKALLGLSLCFNLGLLGVFKYYSFLFQTEVHWLLPVGISFYTFQTMSYTFDVYRKRLAAHQNFIEFSCYVAFFPQLVAGPIVRAGTLLPQLKDIQLQKKYIEQGFFLFCTGLFKKVLIADILAVTVVDKTFADLANYSFFEILWATTCYAFQIYNDFSGYSDMAIGLALILGVKLPANFAYPYGGIGFKDFWKKWHISLSSWLKDYLYIPLGGNRGGMFKTQKNILITMILGGLWHGAGLNFILWGTYHGVLVCLENLLGAKFGFALPRFLKVIATFTAILFGWFIFRIENTSDLTILLDKWGDFSLKSFHGDWFYLVGIVLAQFLIHFYDARKGIENYVLGIKPLFKYSLLALFFIFIYGFCTGQERPYVYFQF